MEKLTVNTVYHNTDNSRCN